MCYRKNSQKKKKKGEIDNRGVGQEKWRSAGYLDVSVLTSKGPSGIYTKERNRMPGNQSFEVYSGSRKEVLNRDKEHRRITYEWEEVLSRDFSIRKRFSREVFMTQSVVRKEEEENRKKPSLIPAVCSFCDLRIIES